MSPETVDMQSLDSIDVSMLVSLLSLPQLIAWKNFLCCFLSLERDEQVGEEHQVFVLIQ